MSVLSDRFELKTTREAQGSLLAAAKEEDAKEIRARVRDTERRVGLIEGRGK